MLVSFQRNNKTDIFLSKNLAVSVQWRMWKKNDPIVTLILWTSLSALLGLRGSDTVRGDYGEKQPKINNYTNNIPLYQLLKAAEDLD